MAASWTQQETVNFCDVIPISAIVAGAGAVTVLRGTNVTLSDFGDTADAPSGWTTVTPRILQDNTDLQSYLPLTGGTLTGDLIVPHIKQSQSGALLAESSTDVQVTV